MYIKVRFSEGNSLHSLHKMLKDEKPRRNPGGNYLVLIGKKYTKNLSKFLYRKTDSNSDIHDTILPYYYLTDPDSKAEPGSTFSRIAITEIGPAENPPQP